MKNTEYSTFRIQGIGPRKEMQDVITSGTSSDHEFHWFIVCDGIGGSTGGKIAAATTATCLTKYLKKHLIQGTQLHDISFIRKGLDIVQKRFARLIAETPALELMGTTLCLSIFTKSHVHIFWSGDARFYLFSENQCIWNTHPHNFSFDLYRNGTLTLEEAQVSETSYLTASINNYTPSIRLDYKQLHLQTNDRILTCTDGIWGLFEHEDLVSTMTKQSISKTSAFLRSYLKEYANDNYSGFLLEKSCTS